MEEIESCFSLPCRRALRPIRRRLVAPHLARTLRRVRREELPKRSAVTPMERGLLVELSPNEEIALRRIAEGMVETKDVQERHLERLKLLAIVEVTKKDFRLTGLGPRRLSMLRR
jgi:hypothetical protein